MRSKGMPRPANGPCELATVLAFIALCSTPALAQATKKVLTLSSSLRVVEAAKSEAERRHWPCVVAVVDDGGWLVAFERMDKAPMLASVQLAEGKAKTAAIFRKPTSVLEKSINGGRYAAITAPGAVEMQGGVPLVLGGEVIGAVGISADTPDHDQTIAEAAVRALVAPDAANQIPTG